VTRSGQTNRKQKLLISPICENSAADPNMITHGFCVIPSYDCILEEHRIEHPWTRTIHQSQGNGLLEHALEEQQGQEAQSGRTDSARASLFSGDG